MPTATRRCSNAREGASSSFALHFRYVTGSVSRAAGGGTPVLALSLLCRWPLQLLQPPPERNGLTRHEMGSEAISLPKLRQKAPISAELAASKIPRKCLGGAKNCGSAATIMSPLL